LKPLLRKRTTIAGGQNDKKLTVSKDTNLRLKPPLHFQMEQDVALYAEGLATENITSNGLEKHEPTVAEVMN
jgi:hypothetical protein